MQFFVTSNNILFLRVINWDLSIALLYRVLIDILMELPPILLYIV